MQHCTPEQLALAALREPLPAHDAAHVADCDRCRADVASLQRAVDAVAMPVSAEPVPAEPAPAEDAQVLPFRSRRRPWLLVAAAVVAGAAVGAGAVAVVQNRGDDGQPVTAVALAPLADNDASGRAEVVRRDDGSRVVEVELDAPALEGSYYEIWLIDREVVGMVPLGVVRPGTQTFELPAGLDLGEFPLVDVSVEPLDGDPTHSGVSVARGELDS